MRPSLTIMLALGAALSLTAISVTSPAQAEVPVDAEKSSLSNSGTVILKAGTPGSSGGGFVAPASTGGSGGMCSYNGSQIPCTKDGGWWSAAKGCYISGPVTFFEPENTGAPASVDDSAFFECAYPGGGVSILRLPINDPIIAVDPEVLARRAIEQMGLQAITIGIVPEPGPDSIGLVGLPVWMWVDQPAPTTWGPLTGSASDGATTVTATARVATIDWNMGDGSVVTCTTPGTPYTDAYDDAMSPDCGHRYTRTSVNEPGQAYLITATSEWEITWTGGGQTGVIPLTLTTNAPIRVGELQVLTTRQG